MSKKVAHHFHNLPLEGITEPGEDETRHIYLYCLIHSLGGGQELFNILKQGVEISLFTAVGDIYTTGDRLGKFTLILQKLIDWDFHQLPQFERQRVLGFIAHTLRDDPDFQIKGRTLPSFLRLVNAYYNQLALAKSKTINLAWKGAPYKNWEDSTNGNTYQIVQLLSEKVLILESRVLSHCVQSSAAKCRRGESFIYSLQKLDKYNNFNSVVTIEVNRAGRIVQAKAKYNATPSKQELQMIKAWAKREKIAYSLSLIHI